MSDDLTLLDSAQRLPMNLFWRESFPQHFSGTGNYQRAEDAMTVTPGARASKIACAPLPADYDDWRNKNASNFWLLERFFYPNGKDPNTTNNVIDVAEAMQDQFDSHYDHRDSLSGGRFEFRKHADCTHYCVESPVHAYGVAKIVSAIMSRLPRK